MQTERKTRVVTARILGDPRPDRAQKAPTPQTPYADSLLRKF